MRKDYANGATPAYGSAEPMSALEPGMVRKG